jgi:hypothetical protein
MVIFPGIGLGLISIVLVTFGILIIVTKPGGQVNTVENRIGTLGKNSIALIVNYSPLKGQSFWS